MKTNISCKLYDYKTKKAYDISDAVSDLQLVTKITDDPGKATFSIITPDKPLNFNEGAGVEIKLDGHGMFKGYVFKKKINQDKYKIEVTAYDQLRYLKNKDSMVFRGKTSNQIFAQICDEFVLKYKVRDASSYVCASKSNDNCTLYEMIQNALDDTLINTGKWFIIRDNFGILEHVNVHSLQPRILIGDGSGLLEFDYETSIDDETYNQIKLYRDDQKSGKRKVWVVNDTKNGGKNLLNWGVLQLYDKVDDNLTEAQVKQKAYNLLDLYNHPTRTLKLTSIGHYKVTAGSVLRVNIKDMGNMNIDNEVVLVTSCTHKIEDSVHTMELEVQVMQKG